MNAVANQARAAVVGRPRILCVDDEPRVLQGLRQVLFRSFEITAAAGGVAGLFYALMVNFNIFSGYGGRLGTIAFLALLAIVWIPSLLKKK